LTGDKSFYLWNGTETYYQKLRAAYTDILNDSKSEYLYFGFFTLCASTLEYSLNFILADYCIDKFGPDNYKTYCKEYMGLSFRNKLLMIPHIVSDGKYMLNEDHPSFMQLEDLITLRNRILHNKEFLKEINIPIQGELIDGKIFVPIEKSEIEISIDVAINYIDTLTKEKCINYGNALGDFKQFIMTPALTKDLEENPMIMVQTW
jgi:hypothetical protein